MKFRNLLIGCLLQVAVIPGIASQQIEPIPTHVKVDEQMVKLGKKLFFDVRLSADDTISCASCHELTTLYGTDRQQFSTGIRGQKGGRNAPTVYNAVFNFKQFWDGRAEDLAEQAAGPVTNPVEMGMLSWDDAVEKIKAIPEYKPMFDAVFNGNITARNIQTAIAEFEKTLITANSPFDQYLRGNENAISAEQKKGYELFKAYGCVACHQGRNVGGNMFQKFGAMKDINLKEGSVKQDLGRWEVTKNKWDKHVFKVPSLRLAVKTPPYLHDGSIKTLEEVVDIMIEYQLDRQVPESDRKAIIAFLNSLVGELPETAK